MTDAEREKVVLAACMAATFKPDYMTNDKLEAATKGHGSLVIPVYCAANSLAEDVFCNIGSPGDVADEQPDGNGGRGSGKPTPRHGDREGGEAGDARWGRT